MKRTYYKEDHKKVILNTAKDTCLFLAPRPTMKAGQCTLPGRDLYVHRTGNKDIYYFVYWSSLPEKQEQILPVSSLMAERFLAARGLTCITTDPRDLKAVETLQRYGYGILEEF